MSDKHTSGVKHRRHRSSSHHNRKESSSSSSSEEDSDVERGPIPKRRTPAPVKTFWEDHEDRLVNAPGLEECKFWMGFIAIFIIVGVMFVWLLVHDNHEHTSETISREE